MYVCIYVCMPFLPLRSIYLSHLFILDLIILIISSLLRNVFKSPKINRGVILNPVVLWVITSCNLVSCYQTFREPGSLHLLYSED
jgi:hypothetical protein